VSGAQNDYSDTNIEVHFSETFIAGDCSMHVPNVTYAFLLIIRNIELHYLMMAKYIVRIGLNPEKTNLRMWDL
jgi:hypothetical protein